MVRTRFIGSGREREGGFLGTHKQDFEAHRTGGDWRHDADQININPTLPAPLDSDNVQGVLEGINDSFGDHFDGTANRHTADQIDMNPELALYPFPTVQATLEEMANNPIFDDLNVSNLIASENVTAVNITASSEIRADYFRGSQNKAINWNSTSNLTVNGYADLTTNSTVVITATAASPGNRINFINGGDIKNGERIRVFVTNDTGDLNYNLLQITGDGSYEINGLGDGVNPGVYFRNDETVVFEVGKRGGQPYITLLTGSPSTNLMWVEMRLSPESIWGASWSYAAFGNPPSVVCDGVSNTAMYYELCSPQSFLHVPRATKLVLNKFRIYHYNIGGAVVINPSYTLSHMELPIGSAFTTDTISTGNLSIGTAGDSGFTANGWTPRRAEFSTSVLDRFILTIKSGTGVDLQLHGAYLGFRILPNDGTAVTP